MKMLAMPVGNATVRKAFDERDHTIGVQIILLLTPEHFDHLPPEFRDQAHRVYAEPR